MRILLTSIITIAYALFLTSCKRSNDAPAEKTLHHALSNIAKNQELAGLSVRLIDKGTTVVDFNTGYADTDREIPVSDSTLFRIASISKTFTALALMQLYEKGQVDLDTDVSEYLGWPLRNPKHPETPITLRMLLSHKSSLRDGKGYSNFSKEMFSEDLHIKELFTPEGEYFTADLFADEVPGTYFSYTNCSWGIIASVIEEISGTTLENYCIQNLFTPMEMDARFDPAHITNPDRIAVLYRYDDDRWLPQADNFKGVRPSPKTDSLYTPGSNGLLYGPQGSLRCSVNDLTKVVSLFREKGKYNNTQIIKNNTLKEMQTPEYIFNGTNGDTWDGFFLSYGLGLHLITATPGKDMIFPGRKMTGHPGIAYGLLSDLYFDPTGETAVIFVTNGSKKEFTYGENSSFYQSEEDVFRELSALLR